MVDRNADSRSVRDFSVKARKARSEEAVSGELLRKLLAALENQDIDTASRLINSMRPLEGVANLDYWKLNAMYQAQIGNLPAAQTMLRKVLEVAPDDANARLNLERVEAAMRAAAGGASVNNGDFLN
ncbi:hypothetical protein WJ39_17825 [Burkholderia diffusa]|nr:hypothetical protein WJ39_17825 [Burkholderia diffusa]